MSELKTTQLPAPRSWRNAARTTVAETGAPSSSIQHLPPPSHRLVAPRAPSNPGCWLPVLQEAPLSVLGARTPMPGPCLRSGPRNGGNRRSDPRPTAAQRCSVHHQHSHPAGFRLDGSSRPHPHDPKVFSQVTASAVDSRFHGSLRDVQHAGNLLIFHLLQVPQDHGLPQLRRHAVKRRAQFL